MKHSDFPRGEEPFAGRPAEIDQRIQRRADSPPGEQNIVHHDIAVESLDGYQFVGRHVDDTVLRIEKHDVLSKDRISFFVFLPDIIE